MESQLLKKEFYHQLNQGKKELLKNDFKTSFYHFENAHILGQKHIVRHTISHYYMLVYGVKTNNFKEIIGQVLRIIASLLFTCIWVPRGNSGGSNISSIKIMPIRKELKKYL